MSRKWCMLAVAVSLLGSLNGCCHRLCDRPGLLARIRGQSATPYTEQFPTSMPSYPMMLPAGANGNGGCCNGAGQMMIPGGGFPGGPGVMEQLPGQFPGINPGPPPSPGSSAPGEAKPLPAGPSGDMVKGSKTGRVTTLPDLK